MRPHYSKPKQPYEESSAGEIQIPVGDAALVHKQPFAPTNLDMEPSVENVFQKQNHMHHHHRSKAVRFFIGPFNTNWMQPHKRWWARTAEKLENDTGKRGKIRRRFSSSKTAKDDKTTDIFAIHKHHKRKGSEEHARSYMSDSSLSSMSSFSSVSFLSDMTDAHTSPKDPDHNTPTPLIDDMGVAVTNVDEPELYPTSPVGLPDSALPAYRDPSISPTIDTQGASTAAAIAQKDSEPSTPPPSPLHPTNAQSTDALSPIPAPNSIPMPKLQVSPKQEPPMPLSAPMSINSKRKSRPTSAHSHHKNGLSALKSIFRRPSKRKSMQDKQPLLASPSAQDLRNYTLKVPPEKVSHRSLETIPSMVSTVESLEITPISPNRRVRASSLSHSPLARDFALAKPPAPPRRSLDASLLSSKLNSLHRSAIANRSRALTWQASISSRLGSRAGGGNDENDDDPNSKMLGSVPTMGSNSLLARADLYIQHMVTAAEQRGAIPISRTQTTSSLWKSRRAMVAKVKAYYHRHSQLSENTVILSTRAVVRQETASPAAFTDKYNEVTSSRLRQSYQEWSEMWLALTKRGILFYLISKKQPTVQILFPPYISLAPRVSMYSTLDMSLAITFYTRNSIESSVNDKKKQQQKSTKSGGKKSKVAAKTSNKLVVDDDAEIGSNGKGCGLRVVIIKFPSLQVACEWYREIGQILMMGRVMHPSCFLGPAAPIAQPAPNSVVVNVPELGVKVKVMLGRHSGKAPSYMLLGRSDEDRLLEQQWRCETTTAWHVRRGVINALLSDDVVRPQMQQWLDAEKQGLMTIGMAWRRFDRLDWITPCGTFDKEGGDFIVNQVNEMIVGPQLLEKTHVLEMRISEHYPDAVVVDGNRVSEPLAIEGFVMLKRSKRRRTEIVAYRPALLASHDSWLFFVHTPRSAQHMDVLSHACTFTDIPGQSNRELDSHDDGVGQVVTRYHPDLRACTKQISLAKYMLNVAEIEDISPLQYDVDDEDSSLADSADTPMTRQHKQQHGHHRQSNSITSIDMYDTAASGGGSLNPTSPRHKQVKGKLMGLLKSRKHKQASCKLKLVMRNGITLVLWTASDECMQEWISRLTELRYYWTNRLLSDLVLRSEVGVLNYTLQGRRTREKDMPEWNEEKAWADRAIWHACLILGCRGILMSGILYRKRHRHQGMRKVFCILTPGRLVEYKCPDTSPAPIQSMLAGQMVHRDIRMSQLFGCQNEGDDDEGSTVAGDIQHQHHHNLAGLANANGSNSTIGSSSVHDDSQHHHHFHHLQSTGSESTLLFTKSRSLSLRRCYVVSKFIDDFNTHDIMCEPWVMTDVGNYSGLRLADKIYADGVVSHELFNDCVFTVWRPTFVPTILRAKANSEIKEIPEDPLLDSMDENQQQQQQQQPNSEDSDLNRSSSMVSFATDPTPDNTHSHLRQPSITFSSYIDDGDTGLRSAPAPHDNNSDAVSISGASSPLLSPKYSMDETNLGRSSESRQRMSGDGYLSSVSNESSAWSVEPPHFANAPSGKSKSGKKSKLGAYRVGNEIRVNVDDRHKSGSKRMSAMSMVSSMRRRVGVYKARSNAEMEQWVTAINQEIRRMSLSGEW